MKDFLIKLINNSETLRPYSEDISYGILLIVVLLMAYLSFYIIKPLLLKLVSKLTEKSKTHWDDVLYQERFFHKIALLVPVYTILFFIPFFTKLNQNIHDLLINSLDVVLTIIIIQIVLTFLNAANTIFIRTEKGKRKSIKGYIQVIKILVYFIGVITIFSIITGENALNIFTGLGAFAAILILIFQDAIKGLASGVQLSANDMVRMGDWISMPKFGADGVVIDISLTTVKIQNWDKTISMVPSYSLISDSFSNWRGMEESGGRRIKRALYVDVTSVHFLSQEEKTRLSEIGILTDYINKKETELAAHNKSINNLDKNDINGRKLTNIGIFRKYLEEYIKSNDNINTNMTFMVRQLESSDKGLPIEIYAFSKVKDWTVYEGIQSDIFDHVYSSLNTFGLKAFQSPSGNDFQSLKN